MNDDAVILGDPAADPPGDLSRRLLVHRARALGRDDQLLFSVGGHAERGRAAGAQAAVGRPSGLFEVLGEVVAAADDDHILDPTRHVQVSVLDQTQVAGAQVWAVPTGQLGTEALLAVFGTVPVAVRDTRAGYPDLAHLAVRADRSGLRIDDLHRGSGNRAADRDQLPGLGVRRGGGMDRRTGCGAGHQERGLGEPVHGQERRSVEAARSERLGEPVHGGGPYRLRAAERELPVAQVEPA